jgi:hypothetical protein
MNASLSFAPADAEQSEGESVRWFANRRTADGVDVTAVRRTTAADGSEQWTSTSIRVPAWAPRLAAFLEKELAQ